MAAKRARKQQQAAPEPFARIVALGADGALLAEMQAALKLTPDEWEKRLAASPKFARAVTLALLNSRAWWERTGRQALAGGVVDLDLYKYMMNNAWGYSDRTDNRTELKASLSAGHEDFIRRIAAGGNA